MCWLVDFAYACDLLVVYVCCIACFGGFLMVGILGRLGMLEIVTLGFIDCFSCGYFVEFWVVCLFVLMVLPGGWVWFALVVLMSFGCLIIVWPLWIVCLNRYLALVCVLCFVFCFFGVYLFFWGGCFADWFSVLIVLLFIWFILCFVLWLNSLFMLFYCVFVDCIVCLEVLGVVLYFVVLRFVLFLFGCYLGLITIWVNCLVFDWELSPMEVCILWLIVVVFVFGLICLVVWIVVGLYTVMVCYCWVCGDCWYWFSCFEWLIAVCCYW